MSNYEKGKTLELRVAKILRSKLGARIERDKRSGAGVNRADITDYFNDLPLHVEVKNQQTVNIKEWYRQADAAASFTKAPTVVFAMDEEILACLRFSDLVNFLVEIADNRAEIDDLKQPVIYEAQKPNIIKLDVNKLPKNTTTTGKVCKAGHIADSYGFCLIKGCKFSRGYKAKKDKKGKK